MIIPPLLKQGDKVIILSTARKIDKPVVEKASEILTSWGLEVVYGINLFKVENQFAGSDAERLSDIQSALDDPEIKAIICARGGYGTLRLIDQISFDRFKKSPKWLVGYSDITVLHSHLQQVIGCESLHASMPVNFGSNTIQSLDLIRQALFSGKLKYEVQPSRLNRSGISEGRLVGGNLSILYALSGSVSFPDTKGMILFIEDVDEYMYHIDRIMMNLKRSGALEDLSGLVVGGMTDMKDNEVPFGKEAREIIRDAVSGYNFPVCFDFPAGHLNENLPLILGGRAKLTVKTKEVVLQNSY